MAKKTPKAKAGQKICPDCQAINGVRTQKCQCGYKFPVGKSNSKKSSDSGLDDFIYEREKIDMPALRIKHKAAYVNLVHTKQFIAKYGSVQNALAAIKEVGKA
jgi:hypothetical protein